MSYVREHIYTIRAVPCNTIFSDVLLGTLVISLNDDRLCWTSRGIKVTTGCGGEGPAGPTGVDRWQNSLPWRTTKVQGVIRFNWINGITQGLSSDYSGR